MPLICIATITLNNAQGLEKTYKSIKSQAFKDYKWLVQDGGSKDSSLNFLKKTPAIIESAKDSGIYAAMNRLITRANDLNYDYILFLNAGDTLAAPETLQIIANALNNCPAPPAFIYGDAMEQSINGDINHKPAKNHEQITYGMFTHHQSMLYKIASIGDLRYNESYKIASDYDFTARFLAPLTSQDTLHIPAPICIFQAGGISQSQTTLGRDEQFQIRKSLALCSPLKNHIITILQRINMTFRTIAPNLYWSLKRP